MSFETATSAPATRKNPLLFEIVLRGVAAIDRMILECRPLQASV